MKAVGCAQLFILHFPFTERKEMGKRQRKCSSDTQGRICAEKATVNGMGLQKSLKRMEWLPSHFHVLRLLPAISPSEWLAFAEYLLCAKDCAWPSACLISITQISYLSWEPAGVSKKDRLGQVERRPDDHQTCGLGLVDSLLHRAWWAACSFRTWVQWVEHSFIQQIFVEYFYGKLLSKFWGFTGEYWSVVFIVGFQQ